MPDNAPADTAGEPKGAPGAPTFRALDPELPRLAARAAFQLDNLRLLAEGKSTGESKTDAIDQFAHRLQRALTLSAPPGDRRALLDPLTTSLLHEAVIQGKQNQPTTLNDVLAEVGKLTRELIQVEQFRLQVDDITALRDFCLVVSDLAASKQRHLRSSRPPHRGPKASPL